MMRRKAGLKLFALVGLFTAALASGACSDEEDAPTGGAGTSGKGGSSGEAGEPSGGTSSSGSSSGGTKSQAGTGAGGGGNAAGSESGGTSSSAGTSNGIGGDSGGEPAMAGAGAGGVMPGGAGAGGEPMLGNGGEAGAAPVTFATLVNPGFETGTDHTVPTGWTNEGTTGAAYVEYSGAHSGYGKLSHWSEWVSASSPPYTARTYQTLDPIENGTYSFSMWVNRDWADEQYLFATGYDMDNPTAELQEDTVDGDGYVKITLSGIPVTSGKVTVGVYSANGAGTWANFDDAELVKE